MVQISVVSNARLSSVEGSVAGAGRIAEAVKGTSSSGGGSSDRDGADVERDRQHLAASGKFVAEGKARSTANANAAEASSLLQIADEALAEIRTRLDRMAELALAAEQSGLSIADRARMDVEFQSGKAEIDAIAADTAFNKIKLLQGGAGAGGAFEVSFKVGTGNKPHDDIVVSIAPASVSDLSAGLAVGSITSMVGAATAATNVAGASDTIDTIRRGIAGDIERFSIASRNNSVIGRELDETRAVLTTPTVVIDLAQTVAKRASADSGYDLPDRAVDQLRRLLIRLGNQDDALDPLDNSTAGQGEDIGGANNGDLPLAGSTGQTQTGNKDAA